MYLAVTEIFSKIKIHTGPLNYATLQTGILQKLIFCKWFLSENDFFFFFGQHGMVFFGFQFLGSVLFYNYTHNAKMMFIKQFGTAKLKIQNEEVLN